MSPYVIMVDFRLKRGAIGSFRRLIADRGYDADHLRNLIKSLF